MKGLSKTQKAALEHIKLFGYVWEHYQPQIKISTIRALLKKGLIEFETKNNKAHYKIKGA